MTCSAVSVKWISQWKATFHRAAAPKRESCLLFDRRNNRLWQSPIAINCLRWKYIGGTGMRSLERGRNVVALRRNLIGFSALFFVLFTNKLRILTRVYLIVSQFCNTNYITVRLETNRCRLFLTGVLRETFDDWWLQCLGTFIGISSWLYEYRLLLRRCSTFKDWN